MWRSACGCRESTILVNQERARARIRGRWPGWPKGSNKTSDIHSSERVSSGALGQSAMASNDSAVLILGGAEWWRGVREAESPEGRQSAGRATNRAEFAVEQVVVQVVCDVDEGFEDERKPVRMRHGALAPWHSARGRRDAGRGSAARRREWRKLICVTTAAPRSGGDVYALHLHRAQPSLRRATDTTMPHLAGPVASEPAAVRGREGCATPRRKKCITEAKKPVFSPKPHGFFCTLGG